MTDCNCERCQPTGAACDPEYGYRYADVPGKHCMGCEEPIGDEPYALDTGWARFGQLIVYHQRCAPPACMNEQRVRVSEAMESHG